ncbi:MAG: porin, partial [Chromatiaceae bacterium]
MRHLLSQGVSCATLPTPRPYILLAALLAPGTAMAASDTEIAELRSMLNQMKSQYESRIAALESRLAKAERDASSSTRESGPVASRADKAAATAEPRPMTAPTAPGAVPLVASPPVAASGGALGALTSGSAFNPQISVFLDGNYYQDGVDGEGSVLV